MRQISDKHPLWRHFAGLVENAFCSEVGVCDPTLTDYLAGLLVRFTHIDYLKAIRRAQGKRLEQIAAILAVLSEETPASESDRDRRMYRHIGDYTLFWAGVYPEQLERTNHQRSYVLLDYVGQGKRSYEIVSELATENDVPPSSLFRHLSEDFEFCLYGLGLIRRGWEADKPGAEADGGNDLVF